jgi:GMP synthase-like glutamine amidotransferase
MFHDHGVALTSDPTKADALVFCGGADIDPAFYGQRPIHGTYTNPQRDSVEYNLWKTYAGKKPMLGICRGAQFLNAMAGGSMWQDVNNHGGNPHMIYLLDETGHPTGEEQRVNTVHHQMMIPASSGIVLAVAFESTKRFKDGGQMFISRDSDDGEDFDPGLGVFLEDADPEIIYYPREQYYCFQAHPEFGHPPTTKLFFRQVNELFK